MQQFNLLTYADQTYRPMQAKLVEHATGLQAFDFIFTETRADFEETVFYKENKAILDLPRGAGYCLWKPFFILRTLMKMREGDVLLYMDSADWIEEGHELRDAAIKLMVDKSIYLTDGAFKHSDWTKRDTFVIMGCDKPEYHNAIQLEAGIVLLKKCRKTLDFVNEWLGWCKNASVITEQENVCQLPNLDGFREHRYDQSVLTNLKIKDSVPSGNALRKFIHCNVNMP